MGNANQPLLSVVVVIVSDTTRSRYDLEHLEGTLQALAEQAQAPPLEIIVPYLTPLEGIEALKRRYARVHFIPVHDLPGYDPLTPGREHHDQLRARGLAAATGDLVALLEDHGCPDRNWAAAMVKAHRSEYAGMGGAIENGADRALNQAVYFCDFGRYQNPLRAGESEYASDENTVYKREALEAVRSVWRDSFQETAVNQALRTGGRKLALTPDAVVYQRRRGLRLGDALKERAIWGRSYAISRCALISGGKRLYYAALSGLLPAVLTLRIARVALSKGRTPGALLRALPLVALLTSAWACGEFSGYLKGAPAPVEAAGVRTQGAA
jgi:hypothetical protein